MSSVPTVSAIITTYRRADVLPRAIRSVLAQTVADLEVLVVDDEPSDATRSATETFRDRRVRYLAHDQNRGPSVARNTGVAAARAPYVAFLDDDDEWTPTKLERQLEAMRVAGGRAVVTSYERWLRNDGTSRVRDVRVDGDVQAMLERDDVVHMQTLLLPRDAFDLVGPFDEQLLYHEDLDMALRLSRVYSFVTVPEPLTVIHVTPDSLSRDSGNRIRALERIIDKHPALRDDPKLRSRWTYRLARLHGEDGERSVWRSRLVESIRLDPSNLRATFMLAVGTVSSPRAHLELARLRNRANRKIRTARARWHRVQ